MASQRKEFCLYVIYAWNAVVKSIYIINIAESMAEVGNFKIQKSEYPVSISELFRIFPTRKRGDSKLLDYLSTSSIEK